jgi:SAM-dependent methyltransferase
MPDLGTMRGVDFGRTAADYATHRAGVPGRMFDRLGEYGIGQPGQRILDLGTGTGAMARPLAERGADVVGMDVSAELLTEARRLAATRGAPIGVVRGSANMLPFADQSFDGVTASQCWHWFDRPVAAAECMRVLQPRGWIVINHFDWLPLPANVVAATEELILAHNPAWKGAGGRGMYPQWAVDVGSAGFAEIETFSFDIDAPYSHEAWRGRVRASAGVGGSLPADAVARFDAELAELLAGEFPEEPLLTPHRAWALVGKKA